MQRTMVLVGLIAAACVANAQTPTAPKSSGAWATVEAQAVGTKLQVQATHSSATCVVKSVTDDALICTRGGQDLTFPHAEVRRVRMSHRLRSTLIGLGAGAGVGAVAGAAVGSASNGFFTKAKAAGVLAAPFAVIGAAIGASTDFSHSTIYNMK